MGREVRRVPKDWEHPKDDKGRYKPLFEGYNKAVEEFMGIVGKDGLQKALDWFGVAPNKDDYMPDWTEKEATYYMMYETCTEGTPISPAFETPEELASWLTDNGASSFGSMTASYESWLQVAKGRSAISAVYSPETGLISGVEGLTKIQKDK